MARSKLATVDGDQTLTNGLTANFAPKATLLLANQTWKVGDLVKKLTARRAARTKTTAAKAAYAAAVGAEETIEAEVAPLRKGLQRTLQGRYGDDSTKLAEFGFSPVKRAQPTAETKALAVQQRQATREARGTKSKKAKATIKGVVPSNGGVTASGGSAKNAGGASATTGAVSTATNGTAPS